MREVYRRFGAAEDPRRATLEELEQVASEVAGVDLGPLFRSSVEEAGVMALGEHLGRAGLGIGKGTGSAESIVVLDDASEAELALRRGFLAPVIAPSDS